MTNLAGLRWVLLRNALRDSWLGCFLGNFCFSLKMAENYLAGPRWNLAGSEPVGRSLASHSDPPLKGGPACAANPTHPQAMCRQAAARSTGGSVCPHCRSPLEGLGTFCWQCQRYTDGPDKPAAKKAPTIEAARSEDERKHDARPTVEALGWKVVDTEQGWRPFECPACKNPIPGGTRVTTGFPDWLVMGHGLVVFCEWKSATGTQSDDQKAFEGLCRVAGVPYRVIRTTSEAVAFLEEVKP